MEVLEHHAPVKKREVRNRQCPFLEQEIKELMDERDQVHRVARESGAVTDWEHYRWCRYEVKRRLYDAERIYVQKEMNGNQSSSAMWKVIRNCIPSKKKSRPVYSRDMTELANDFNEFFTSVGARAAAESKRLASVNILPAYKPPSAKTLFQLEEFRFRAVTTFEVHQIILSFPSNRAAMAVEHLSEDLRRIAAWCCTHSLLINPDKTKLLLLGTPQMLARVPEGFGVTLLGKEILPSRSAKDLGVIVDSRLSFDEHVSEVVSRCTGSLCQINRVKHLFDSSTLITIINSLVKTHFNWMYQ